MLLEDLQAFPQQQKCLEKYAALNWLLLSRQRLIGIDD